MRLVEEMRTQRSTKKFLKEEMAMLRKMKWS